MSRAQMVVGCSAGHYPMTSMVSSLYNQNGGPRHSWDCLDSFGLDGIEGAKTSRR